MVQITIEIPEALAERFVAVHERLPEVLAHGLEAWKRIVQRSSSPQRRRN